LLIQQNVDGSNFFHRPWAEFKVGFGDPSGNYWLGNDLLSQLTLTGRYKLRFDLQSGSNPGNWYNAEYSTFRVLPETDNYRVVVTDFSGNATDAFAWYHNGMMFTTHDRDNDPHSGNCATVTRGGFWHNTCFRCGVTVSNTRPAPWRFIWHRLPGGWDLQTSRMWLECK